MLKPRGKGRNQGKVALWVHSVLIACEELDGVLVQEGEGVQLWVRLVGLVVHEPCSVFW